MAATEARPPLEPSRLVKVGVVAVYTALIWDILYFVTRAQGDFLCFRF